MKSLIITFILLSKICSGLECQSKSFIISADQSISNCAQTEIITKKLEVVIEQMNGALEFPQSKIKLNITLRSEKSFFDGELNLPLFYERVQGAAKNNAVAIWLHELGHVYFDTQYGKHNPEYKQIVASKKPSIINRVVLPYNELFADAFAVFWLNNAQGMYEILIEAGLPSQWEMTQQDFLYSYQGRNFSEPNNELNRWAQSNDPYDLFAPVRFHIGQKFDFSKSENIKKNLLKIYKAIESEVDRALKNPNANDYRQMNERLIQKI